MLGESSMTGADCWGLVTMVSELVYGVRIGERLGCSESGSILNAIITDEITSSRWIQQKLVSIGNVAVMFDKKTDRPLHVGIVVDEGHILHSPDDNNRSGSQIHKIKLLNKIFSRLEYYKYDNRFP